MKKLIALAILIPIAFACSNSKHDAHVAIVKEYVKSVENMDYATMERLLADEYHGLGPSANDTIGKVEALENWKKNVENLYQKIEYTRSQYVGITIDEGDNKGDWVSNWAELVIDYQNDRGSVKIWANSIYKIDNGKIVKSYTFYNEADVLRQLGYVFINPNNI